MKPWIKILIGTVIGFAGGFAAGFFSHKKMNDVQFEEISEEEMKEIEEKIQKSKEAAEHAKESISETFAKKPNKIFPDSDLPDSDLPDDPDELKLKLQKKTPYIQADSKQKMQYEKMWKATKDYSSEDNANRIPVPEEDEADSVGPEEDEFDDQFLEMLEEEEVTPGSAFVDPPHLIGLVEYYNERPEFDKITINWWQGDNTWTDDNEEIIQDISSYVGTIDIVKEFEKDEPDEDPDIRFIRNEQYGTDYEIIRHHRGWKENTGG